jgi:hypothetical protein
MRAFIYLLLISILLMSCKKSFIERQPVSQVSAKDFFKTEADIEQGVTGVYDALQSYGQYGRNFVYFMEVRADNSTLESTTAKGGIYGDFEDFRLQPANVVLNETWKACYSGIQRCNIVLNRIEGIAMDGDKKKQRTAEVKFIRCLTYYNLVQIWGKVPLVLTETQDPFDSFGDTRTEVATIYSYLEKELAEAIPDLPATYAPREAGRVTTGAAQTLLAKVYLLQQKYEAAKSLLAQIITSGNYHLLASYASVFDVTNNDLSESIFRIQFLKGGVGEGSAYVNLFAPLGDKTLTGGVGNTFGENVPTAKLVASYTKADKRFPATIDSIAKGRYYNKKFLDKPFQDMDANSNFIVFRYADVLLMYAEAANESGALKDAVDHLNEVRVRAGLDGYKAEEISGKEQCRLAIEQERQLELCFENHRWFDLKRTGRANDVMKLNGYNVLEHQLLFPVPQSQIDITNGRITQNPVY